MPKYGEKCVSKINKGFIPTVTVDLCSVAGPESPVERGIVRGAGYAFSIAMPQMLEAAQSEVVVPAIDEAKDFVALHRSHLPFPEAA